MTTDTLALQRLLSWTSPSFPIGAFSYSGGLEAAIEEGLVADRDSLGGWCRESTKIFRLSRWRSTNSWRRFRRIRAPHLQLGDRLLLLQFKELRL